MKNNETLPTDELKKYGIIEADNSFSKKLSADDIQKFLQGQTIVADNNKDRITFQLTDNNSRLNVNIYERNKSITDLLLDSQKEIQYSDISSKYDLNDEKSAAQLAFTKTAFVYDEKNKNIIEYDMIKNAKELTNIVAERKNADEINLYKVELQKLQSFLQDKIDKYPEIAKEISVDLNIVSKEINSVNSIARPEQQMQKEGKSDVQLNVNDPDLYEDANRQREDELEQDEERQRPKGRGR